MTFTVLLLLLAWFTSASYAFAQRRARLLLQAEVDGHRSRLLSASEDEGVVAFLEASSEASPLARALLAEAPHRAKGAVAATAPDCEWRHNTKQQTPAEECWNIFKRSILSESGDEDRLKFLATVIANGFWFTTYEREELAAMFDSAGARARAREMMYAPKNSASSSAGMRWPKFESTALITMTCGCGNPATGARGSTGAVLEAKCDSCDTYASVKLVLGGNEIIALANGRLVRPGPNGWVDCVIERTDQAR